MNKIKAALAALGIGAILAVSIPTVVSAHTPDATANCSGVTLKATAYFDGVENLWSVTIGGIEQHGTFRASFNQKFPVPQDGATTAWSARISDPNGGYLGEYSGSVGPCGTPPPVQVNVVGSSTSGTCEANTGSFNYAVTVGSLDGPRAFYVKSLGNGTGGTAETFYRVDGTTGAPGEIVTFATVTAGQSATLHLSGLAPGNYRVTSDGSTKIKAQYKYDFTVVDAGRCIPGVPLPKVAVTHTEWVDGAKDCETKTVTQSRGEITTTTPFDVWDATTWSWLAGTPVVVRTEQSGSRPMTSDELDECAGPEPEAKITYAETDWADGEYDCLATDVEQTRTVSTIETPWDLVNHVWVPATDRVKTTDVVETQRRPLTAEEIATKDADPLCVVVTVVTKPVVELAHAGDNGAVLGGVAAAILAAGGLALFFGRRRKATN